MQTYELILTSEPSNSFYCKKACDSLDINIEEKLSHEFKISGDFKNDFDIGLIVGASGSGKTTIAKHIFNKEIKQILNEEIPVIEQFNEKYSYDERANFLNSIGLSQVTCWIRPPKTLSNGQKFRAEIALQIANSDEDIILIDEWTSVVDRTIAKIMSNSVQKFSRKFKRKIVLISCHYDIIEWVSPDWLLDCNKQEYFNYRGLPYRRTEKIEFTIKECDKTSWKNFSKYHYLSKKIPGGTNYFYGLFLNEEQIGFQCFSNYVPKVLGKKTIYHFNRTVIHPDYVGIGLGLKLINETSKDMKSKGFRIMGKFSSIPVFKSLSKDKKWKLVKIERLFKKPKMGGNAGRSKTKEDAGFRFQVKTFSFEFIG